MIRAVKLPDDIIEINNWLRSRDEKGIDLDFIPPQGFIAPGVAAGFLITTNTGVGYLEHYVSNPRAKKDERAACLTKITEKLIKAGESSGVKIFMALTCHPKIVDLCDQFHFQELKDLRVFGRKK